jgi:isopenicillin N synthase-like dioxygenase
MQTVPALDLSKFSSGSSMDKMAFAKDLVDGLRASGFVRLRNHGIRTWTAHTASRYARDLFALGRRALDAYYVPSSKGQVGYTPPGVERALGHAHPDLKMFWSVSREGDPDNPRHAPYRRTPNVWPRELGGFRGSSLSLYAEMDACAAQVAAALELGLDVAATALTGIIKDGDSLLRFLYYFSLSAGVPDGAMRAAPHKDSNLFTLLKAGEGLVIRSEGKWMPVDPREDELVLNVGDMLERYTNGYLPSTEHAVRNPSDPSTDRLSQPFFVHGHPDAVLRVPERFRGGSFPEAPPDATCGQLLQETLDKTIATKAA